MAHEILVTDSLFIFEEHERLITDAGYRVVRLDTPEATEAQLIGAIRGKVGYILGGIEKVTQPVIDAAHDLRGIAFTGVDCKAFIPALGAATERGIVVTATPGANTYAVAEYTVTIMLAMVRNIFELGRTGTKTFLTTRSLNELTVGIVGMGAIGTKVTEMLCGLGVKKIIYYTRTRKPEVELKYGAEYVSLDELLAQADIVSLHVPKDMGNGFIGKNELARMKDGALIVNCGFMGGVDFDALYAELQTGRLRAIEDGPADSRFSTLPLSVWYSSNAHTAYNTYEANKKASDMATQSLLNVLNTGTDSYRVN